MRKLLLGFVAIVLAACGREEDAGPRYSAKAPETVKVVVEDFLRKFGKTVRPLDEAHG